MKNIVKLKDIMKCNLAEWAFTHMLTFYSKKHNYELHKMVQEKDKQGGYDIHLTINGLEMDFVELFEYMATQDKERINEAALDLINDKFGESQESIYFLLDNFRKEMKLKAKKILGIEIDDEY